MLPNTTQNILLEGSLKTADNQRGPKKPRRLTKQELRKYWSRKITEEHLAWRAKQNQQL